jgi:hypothetical protein
MSMASVLGEVMAERRAQDSEWGGPAHDDAHSEDKWVALLVRHLGLAVNDGGEAADLARYRRQMVRVAALAVAAVEALDRRKPGRGKVAGEHTAGPGY